MDFLTVLKNLVAAFRENNISYGLIGGFALSIWGVPRATVDLDFLVGAEDMPTVHAIMMSLGYSRRYHSINVSQYVSDLRFWGEVDFLHAFRRASLGMLQRTVIKELFDGTIAIKVVLVEDLVGLKIQAMANDSSRRSQDLADIEALMELHQPRLNWDLLAEYFQLFNETDLLQRLRENMAPLTEQERRELKELADSLALREDLQTLARRRSRHFFRNGRVDVDLVVAFLTEFNEMINHQPKPFRRIIDHDMRL